MKHFFISITILILISTAVKAQSTLSATEKKMNDAICNCISAKDLTQIKGKEDAEALFTSCVAEQTEMALKLAEEKKIDFTDETATHNMGVEIGKNLLREKCASAIKLISIIANNQRVENAGAGTSEGTFKRIDLKGFNYVVMADENKNEKSFLWLKQFAGSEILMDATTQFIGKKIKVTWQEIEVYLPQAKGYYKVKEIRSIDFL